MRLVFTFNHHVGWSPSEGRPRPQAPLNGSIRPPAAYDDRDGTEIRSKHTAAPWHMRFVPWPSGGPCARHLPFQAYKCLEKVRLKYAAFSKNTQPVCVCILGLGARAAATHARAHRCWLQGAGCLLPTTKTRTWAARDLRTWAERPNAGPHVGIIL